MFEAVQSAVFEIHNLGREEGAVIMIYLAPSNVVNYIYREGIRAGMKGYPSTKEGTKDLVRKAHENQFELVSVKIDHVDKEVIKFSLDHGVWQLTWDLGKQETLWSELVTEGLGGLITRYPKLAHEYIFSK